MRDLHVLTVAENGTRLVLADSSGEQFSLPLDERLRAALRTEARRAQPRSTARTVEPTPREIQAHVRAGASAEEVAGMAGVAMDRVMRFAAPVLDERAHMARRARGVLLRNESMLELGTLEEVVMGALAARSADDTISWDAWRREDGRWIVSCSWTQDHESHVARWVLDASAGSATPLDDDARALAGLPTQDAAISHSKGQARLAVVPNPGSEEPSQPTDGTVNPEGAAEGPDVDAHATEDETPTGPIPAVADVGTPGPAHPARRARRQRHEDDSERLPLSDLAENIEVEERRAARPARDTGGRQRPAVPSWDEIMFGRRT